MAYRMISSHLREEVLANQRQKTLHFEHLRKLTRKIKSNNILSLSPPIPISKDQRIAGFSSPLISINRSSDRQYNTIDKRSNCLRRLIYTVMFPCSLKTGSCSLVPFDILPLFSCSPKPLGDPQR